MQRPQIVKRLRLTGIMGLEHFKSSGILAWRSATSIFSMSWSLVGYHPYRPALFSLAWQSNRSHTKRTEILWYRLTDDSCHTANHLFWLNANKSVIIVPAACELLQSRQGVTRPMFYSFFSSLKLEFTGEGHHYGTVSNNQANVQY
jgi:hypothetical protein